jgi:3-oxoacyl-[acyl-carrier-protein] synthase II
MKRIAIVAHGAVSAMGKGRDAYSVGGVGERPRGHIRFDTELANAGLGRPFAARVADVPDAGDRATHILNEAFDACIADLDRAVPDHRAMRVGLVLGTSSGGMRTAVRLYDALAAPDEGYEFEDLFSDATYYGPFLRLVQRSGREYSPASLILGACASSTLAIGLAARWVDAGACEIALAGGFDAVSPFVASGFEVLRATTGQLPPRPFSEGRDGMALGEGAAIVALQRVQPDDPRVFAYVTGFGATADAVHITAPDRDGGGLARAATFAVVDAEENGAPVGTAVERIGIVSAHGTATPFNDVAESKAITRVLGARRRIAVVHPLKSQIGHTLGAAGALETLAAIDAAKRSVLPAALREGEQDEACVVRLLSTNEAGTTDAVLKLSAAFGGSNACLVVEQKDNGSERARRDVYVRAIGESRGEIDPRILAARLGQPYDKLSRADGLTQRALDAVGRLRERVEFDRNAGVVIGHSLATMQTNYDYQLRVRERGPSKAEPRKFPYTSPNVCAGDVAIAFDLRGPAFAVGLGLVGGIEAFAVATRLVGSCDAPGMVVVAVDEYGSLCEHLAEIGVVDLPPSDGAIAIYLSQVAEGPRLRVAEASVVAFGEGPPPYAPSSAHGGHEVFLPWTEGLAPIEIATVARGFAGRIRLVSA